MTVSIDCASMVSGSSAEWHPLAGTLGSIGRWPPAGGASRDLAELLGRIGGLDGASRKAATPGKMTAPACNFDQTWQNSQATLSLRSGVVRSVGTDDGSLLLGPTKQAAKSCG